MPDGDFRSRAPVPLRSQAHVRSALEELTKQWYYDGLISGWRDTLGGILITLDDGTAVALTLHDPDAPRPAYRLPGDPP